eukprot:1153215-Pelagomonas_calceolata.AAC.7
MRGCSLLTLKQFPEQPPASSQQVATWVSGHILGSTCRLGGAARGVGHTGGDYGWLARKHAGLAHGIAKRDQLSAGEGSWLSEMGWLANSAGNKCLMPSGVMYVMVQDTPHAYHDGVPHYFACRIYDEEAHQALSIFLPAASLTREIGSA